MGHIPLYFLLREGSKWPAGHIWPRAVVWTPLIYMLVLVVIIPITTMSHCYPSFNPPDILKLTSCHSCHRYLCSPRFPPWPRTVAGMGMLRAQRSTGGPTTTAQQSSPTGPQWCQGTATQLLPWPRHRASSSRGSRSVSPFRFDRFSHLSRSM